MSQICLTFSENLSLYLAIQSLHLTLESFVTFLWESQLLKKKKKNSCEFWGKKSEWMFSLFCFRSVNRIPDVIEVIIWNLMSCYTLVTLCCQIDIIGHQIYVGFMIDIVRLSLYRLFRMLSVLCRFCLPPNCCRVSWIMWPSACPIRRWGRWRVRSMPSCKHRRESFTTRASLWGKVNWTRRREYTFWDEWMRITWIGSF